ncbi:anillin-like [Drosophila miranda]|uniref:anillin-like n=1 Tax=Drosophila miranda TaxID=7229 RepID=UPI00143F5F02|nr:anillin-like [Drosophila miranda]
MDPFIQHMLEKAEQRSRALGISKPSKFPLTECSVASSSVAQNLEPTKPMPNRSHSPAGQSISSSSSSSGGGKVVILDKAMLEASPTKPLRHYAAINKENMAMGIETNITSAKEIGVSFASTQSSFPRVHSRALVFVSVLFVLVVSFIIEFPLCASLFHTYVCTFH